MGIEWPLSTTLPLRPHPSAQPELPGGSPPASLPAPVRPVSLLRSVLRRRHCALLRRFFFRDLFLGRLVDFCDRSCGIIWIVFRQERRTFNNDGFHFS